MKHFVRQPKTVGYLLNYSSRYQIFPHSLICPCRSWWSHQFVVQVAAEVVVVQVLMVSADTVVVVDMLALVLVPVPVPDSVLVVVLVQATRGWDSSSVAAAGHLRTIATVTWIFFLKRIILRLTPSNSRFGSRVECAVHC